MEKLLKFTTHLKSVYPEDTYKKITHILNQPKPKVFRTFDKNVLNDLKLQGFDFEVLFELYGVTVCLLLNKFQELSYTKASEEGKIYIQSVSSMLPVFILLQDILNLVGYCNLNTQNLNVLDLCAAPGSKTTLLDFLLNRQKPNLNSYQITSVEKNRSRFFKLNSNLKLQNSVYVKTVLGDSLTLCKNPLLQNAFDLVLLDAPCSNGAGVYLSDEQSVKEFNSKNIKPLSQLQKKLLINACNVLKPSGTLVYSTCTYSLHENEGVVEWLLQKCPNIKLQELNFCFLPVSISENILINQTARVLPSKYTTAFFIAKFTKHD